MLGNFVKVRITSPMNSFNKRYGYRYKLNYGMIEGGQCQKNVVHGAYIMGINHPVRNFDGRVIASIKRFGNKGQVWVVAPKSTRFIVHDIKKAIDFAEGRNDYSIECYYESSCGAVIFRKEKDEKKFLLIRNKRSAHWGFPKGHVEAGETNEQTAIREIFEETGLHVDILPGFSQSSEYTIQGKIEKTVVIFLAKTKETNYTMQVEEIEECGWFSFDEAMKTLNYENDKRILTQACKYLKSRNI